MPAFFSKISQRPAIVILFFTIVQVLCTTWFLNIPNFSAINSILFLISGTGISFFLLKIPALQIKKPILINKQVPFKLLIIAILLPVSYQLARQILDATPLEKEYADMLPVMKTMCSRFINGHWTQVYEPIPEIWNGIQPVYLPAMWLPFTSSLVFHFDMRWVTVSGIWLSVLLCVLPGIWKRNVLHILYAIALLVLLSWLHFDKVNNVIRLTEEGVVYFYYSLMVIAIISGNPWLIGISAALCLLSRYAIIGWIPFAGLYLLFTRQYKYLLKIVAAGSIVVLVILVLPFGWKPLLDHFQFQSQYIGQAAKVWNENPEFFYNSLGMAKFFGPGQTQLLHCILLSGTFIIPILFLVLLKKKTVATNIAMLSCFQLCITFFYSFLDVSYLYLYYTPVFVSLAIAGLALTVSEPNRHFKKL